MKILAAAILNLVLITGGFAQNKQAVPNRQLPLPVGNQEVPRDQWKTVLAPFSGEYNIAIVGKGKYVCYHAKFNADDDSYSAIVLVSELNLQEGSIDAMEPATPVFNLDRVFHKGPDLYEFQFSWTPNASAGFYFTMDIIASTKRDRAVGFFAQVLRTFVLDDGAIEKDVAANSGVLLMEKGAGDNKIIEFSDDTFKVATDLQDFSDEDSAKVMSLWVTGHYKPLTHEDTGSPTSSKS